jgi:hypothetical protein
MANGVPVKQIAKRSQFKAIFLLLECKTFGRSVETTRGANAEVIY